VLIAQLRKNGAGNDKRTSSPLTPTPRKRN
jgi:hypothetical protein